LIARPGDVAATGQLAPAAWHAGLGRPTRQRARPDRRTLPQLRPGRSAADPQTCGPWPQTATRAPGVCRFGPD